MSAIPKNESGFTPNGDLVLVKPPVVEKKTASGIVLVDTTAEKEARAARVGVVLAAGDQAWSHPRMKGVELGMQVYFGRYAGDFLPIDGVDYIVMRAENILGPIEKAPDYGLHAAKAPMDAFAA